MCLYNSIIHVASCLYNVCLPYHVCCCLHVLPTCIPIVYTDVFVWLASELGQLGRNWVTTYTPNLPTNIIPTNIA